MRWTGGHVFRIVPPGSDRLCHAPGAGQGFATRAPFPFGPRDKTTKACGNASQVRDQSCIFVFKHAAC